jgi:hypothetical protein
VHKQITPFAIVVALVTAASLLGQAKYGFGGVQTFGFFGGK